MSQPGEAITSTLPPQTPLERASFEGLMSNASEDAGQSELSLFGART